MEDALYNNKMYFVDVGVSQEHDQDYLLYQVFNAETEVIEYESSMLIEALEAADFFKDKIDARNMGKAEVVSLETTTAH